MTQGGSSMSRIVESWVLGAALAATALLSGSDALAQEAAAPRPRFQIVDIGALPGADAQDFGGSVAGAVNNRGEVVGMSHSDRGHRAVRWTAADGLVDLGDPPGGGGQAYALNNSGVVVGTGTAGPFVWDEAGGMRPIPQLAGVPGNATAGDISDRGHVVGWVHHNNEARGYLLDPDGRLTFIDPPGTRRYGGV